MAHQLHKLEGVTSKLSFSCPPDAYRDEENWRAQYGQVIKSDEDSVPAFPVVDLWDWKIVTGTKKGGKGLVSRLVGHLVRRSTKLHPSMPSGGNLLKTAPICEAHLDLVRVASGLLFVSISFDNKHSVVASLSFISIFPNVPFIV